MSDYPHLSPQCLPVMALTTAERLEYLKYPRWINYPRAKVLIDDLRELLTYPQQTRMPNILIVGDSNNGKSTLLEHFTEQFGQPYVDNDGNAVRPVVMTQAPPTPTESGLHYAIHSRFWDVRGSTKSIDFLRDRTIKLMKSCQVKMLIVDEMHSFLTGAATKQREVMCALKFLCNELKVPIVGAGIRESVQILHSDPQHRERFKVKSLPNWKADSEFCALVASFERLLPLKKPSNLRDGRIAGHLHWICEGNLGYLRELLMACAKEAILSGAEMIDLSIIKKHEWIRPTSGIREQPA